MDLVVTGVPFKNRMCSPSGLGTVGVAVDTGVGVPNEMVGRGVGILVGVAVGKTVGVGRGERVGSIVGVGCEHADSSIAKPRATTAAVIRLNRLICLN